MLSVLDIFRIGVGPSSSHTVGPMRIAARFVDMLVNADMLKEVFGIRVFLRGSLAFTGHGHGTPDAVMIGLQGYQPDAPDLTTARDGLAGIAATRSLALGRIHHIAFDPVGDIRFDYAFGADLHPNGMHLEAVDATGAILLAETFYSTGGGFIATRRQLENEPVDDRIAVGNPVPLPFGSALELLGLCAKHDGPIDQIVLANEDAMRSRAATFTGLGRVAAVMLASIDRGLVTNGRLPGKLNVERRAPSIWQKLEATPAANEPEQLFDWLNVYAMAVNEENAAGGQVVTAPTNGAAGIIPAIMRHYCLGTPGEAGLVRRFLLTAGGIGLLYKQRASISGAEMGCQGEVGVACSMAAAGLAAIWGASPQQVANAAEIGMEHNLGLTCDPVGGLVQIPCIERNAIGATKAVNAARLAMHRSGAGRVSLDQVIETMRQTGRDMSSKYKETSQGGLAVNVVEC